MNDKTPELEIEINDPSVPPAVKVKLPPSGSTTVKVPIVVWFSSAASDVDELMIGATSFKLVTLTVISWIVSFTPSDTVTEAV